MDENLSMSIEPIDGGQFRVIVVGGKPPTIAKGTAALSRLLMQAFNIQPWMARWTLITDWLSEGGTVLIDEIEKDGETAVRIRRVPSTPQAEGVIRGGVKEPARWCARVASSGGIQITSGNGPAAVSTELFTSLLRLVWGFSPREIKAAMLLMAKRGAVLLLEEELRGTKGKVSSARLGAWPEEPTGNPGGGKEE